MKTKTEMKTQQLQMFRKTVWEHYKKHGRHDLPWRPNLRRASPNPQSSKQKKLTPYQIFVSEVMLQQTQVERVIPKYKTFVKAFPNFKRLACAPQHEVLRHWQGLGYNRRALNLKRAAEIVHHDFGGRLPRDSHALEQLPGIGPYTAGALCAFAFNKPAVFIETNIRTVFLYHYDFIRKAIMFDEISDKSKTNRPKTKTKTRRADRKLNDAELIPLIKQTIDTTNPREWYWALMDYGAHIKKHYGNPNTQSAHHTKQSPFKDSHRQLRGALLRFLLNTNTPSQTPTALARKLATPQKEVSTALQELTTEGFLTKHNNNYRLK